MSSPSDGAGSPTAHHTHNHVPDRPTPLPPGSDAATATADGQAPVQAYAKLEGPDFCYYVRSLEVSLGRHPSGSHTDSVDIDLGDSKAVSRRHARILYNFMSQSFELQVLGKNGCLVDDEYYARGQSVMLRHKMVIQIGDTEFAFLLPKAAVSAEAPVPVSHAHMAGVGDDPVGPRTMMPDVARHPNGPPQPVAHAAYAVNAITPQRLTLYAPPDAARHTPSHLALRHRQPPAPLVFIESPQERSLLPQEHIQPERDHIQPEQDSIQPKQSHTPLQQEYLQSQQDHSQQQQEYPQPPQDHFQSQDHFQTQQEFPQPAAVPIRPASDKPVVDEYSVDPETLAKPTYSYASLIAQAINATSDKKVTLSGIYSFIMQHYPYYRHVQNGWQNSIRHNLSLNKAFVRVQRASNEPGKGSYWAIEDSYKAQFSNGVYKRTRRTKKAMEMDRERQLERARQRQVSRAAKNAASSGRSPADRPIAPSTARPRRTSARASDTRAQSPSTVGSSSMAGDKRMSPDDDDDSDDGSDDADRDDFDDDADDSDPDDEDVVMADDHHRSSPKPQRRNRPAKKRVSTGSNGKGGGALSTGEDTIDYMSSNMGSAPPSPGSHQAGNRTVDERGGGKTIAQEQLGSPASGTRSRTGSIAGRQNNHYSNSGPAATANNNLPSSSRPSQPRPQKSTAH